MYDDFDSKLLVRINYYIVGIGGFLIFFIGIITNTLNLFLLTRKSMKTTTNKYLVSLAICDIFVLIFSTLITSNSLINDYDMIQINQLNITERKNFQNDSIRQSFNMNIKRVYFYWVLNIYPRIYPFAYPLAIMFQVSTVWISLAMSMDRFIAIHFPLKSLKFCTIRNAKRVITFVFVLSLLYSLPRFLEYHTVVHIFTIGSANVSISISEVQYTYKTTQIGESNLFKNIVYFWMYLLFQSVLPLILLTLLNFALIFSLRKSRNFHSKFNELSIRSSSYTSVQKRELRTINKERNRNEVTIMLITLLLTFTILHTPSFLCNFFHGFNQQNTVTTINMSILCSISNFLIMTNSATNFFAYLIFNKPFKRELLYCSLVLLTCKCSKRLREPLQSIRPNDCRRKSSIAYRSNNKVDMNKLGDVNSMDGQCRTRPFFVNFNSFNSKKNLKNANKIDYLARKNEQPVVLIKNCTEDKFLDSPISFV